jgi:solute carrier family 12 (sodium/potassium/chloride transporter), member 2
LWFQFSDGSSSDSSQNDSAKEPLKKKKEKRKKSEGFAYTGPGGQPLSKDVINSLTRFTTKQRKGTIDVWWLYDDGGLKP